jgi:hypothetical protein
MTLNPKHPIVGDRVSFLGCQGRDNEGALVALKPCDTWGQIAQVKWDSGETSHVRYFDLIRTFVRGKPDAGRHPLIAAALFIAKLIMSIALAALLALVVAAGLFMMLAV